MRAAIIWICALSVAAAANADPGNVYRSRFGVLSVDATNNLQWNEKRVVPNVSGNSSLRLYQIYRFRSYDLVVLVDGGGTACPTLLRVARVSRAGVTVSKLFGTCVEQFEILRLDGGLEFVFLKRDGGEAVYRFVGGKLTRLR
jgi:hypothetical protein